MFLGHGTLTPLDEAAAIVLHTLHQPYDLADAYLDAILTLSERRAVLSLIHRRITERKPSAYLTHEALFAGLSFYVDERVLVPRSPIAELIAERFEPWVDEDPGIQYSGFMHRQRLYCHRLRLRFSGCARSMPSTFPPMRWLWRKLMSKNMSWRDQLDLYQSDLFNALPRKAIRYYCQQSALCQPGGMGKIAAGVSCRTGIGLQGRRQRPGFCAAYSGRCQSLIWRKTVF